jgi:hypothetical protein
MNDKPTTGTVSLDNAAVKQKHRLAAGLKVTGQTLPSGGPKDTKTKS